jgi:hypothetical protein
VIYPLDEMLLLCLLAVLAGAETFVNVARFGAKKLPRCLLGPGTAWFVAAKQSQRLIAS